MSRQRNNNKFENLYYMYTIEKLTATGFSTIISLTFGTGQFLFGGRVGIF